RVDSAPGRGDTAGVPDEDAPVLRVSDADREHVATSLREHLAQGRLTLDELAERLDRTYAARTRAELDAVSADLPAERRAAPPAGSRARRRPGSGRGARSAAGS
ncbi:MAG TPA: DUF1707 domain-containing protein, partial [Gemmatimonadales bacterium]|nr:DUF1707 domain-containing protein [Gemmatimonadales bacterium]